MDSACDCDCDFTGEPQIKGGRFEVKCAEINYFPKKIPALKWPRNKEKNL
jgi:hypothetical protein